MTFIDLTQTFSADMPVYPGDPLPELKQTASMDDQEYNEYHLDTGMHVGTHMDAPLHMIANGGIISDILPERFFGRGHIVDARGHTHVTAALLDAKDIKHGDILLVFTDWYRNFREPNYYLDYPEIAPDFANLAVSRGVSIVGLDTPSPDRSPFPIHKILLGAGVLIIENLTNLSSLAGVESFEVSALPAKFACEGAPVRVIARY